MKYSFRKSAFEKEKTYELTNTGIKIIDHEQNESMINYSDIKEVNTSFGATKHNSFYQCVLKTKGGSGLLIKSQHYKGLADFEDRNPEYKAFIEGLHKILKASELDITFKRGIGKVAYIASMIVFVFAGILVPVIGIALLIGGSLWFGIIGIIASVFLVFRMINYSKKNKPGTYTPDDIPASLLPA